MKKRAVFHQLCIMLNLLVLWIMIGFISSPPARADIPRVAESQKEALLRSSRQLLDKDEAGLSEIKEVASILTEYEQKFPEDARIPLYLAKAYYRMAESTEDLAKAYPEVEKTGYYAQKVLSMNPQRTEANYWYGLFLLRKARHVSLLRAYFVAGQGIDQLERVRQLLPEYEHGGASRILGLLYAKAPGWSPFGDREKAIFFAEESTRLDPDYLLNRVYLAEAYQKYGDKKAAIQELHKILSTSPDNNPFLEKAQSMLTELE